MSNIQLNVHPNAKYDSNVTMLRHTAYMNYPSHVHMETMAKCNAACNFCPYPTLNRQGVKMSDALIDKIINDLTEVPREVQFAISPLKVSEPFLDVRIFDIMRSINRQLPQAAIFLTTNASPLTEKKLKELQTIRNIGYIWVSFNDHRKKEYEEVMQLDYERTIDRLNLLHRYATHFPFPVVLSRVGDGSADDAAFQHWVSEHYPRFNSSVFPRGDWLGQVENTVRPVPNMGCTRWFELSITASGVVAHCCMDGQAEYPVGDITKQSVLQVYNSPEYRALRERTVSRLHVSPCNKCTFQ